MRVTLISPERAVYDGEAEAVVAPAYDGQVGILPNHAPFMALLGDGPLTIRGEGGQHSFHVRGGFLQVTNNVVRVVAEHAKEVSDGS